MTPSTSTRKRAFLGLTLSSFSWSLGLGAAVPVIPLLSYRFVPDLGLAGLVTAAGGLGRPFTSYLTGPLMDRFGRRNVATIGIVIRMIFSFMEGFSRNYFQLAFFRFMSGIGTAIWSTGLAVIAADISTREDRGTISGGRTAFGQAGTVVGPLIGGMAWQATGNIRVPFFINGFSKLACLLIFLFMIQETKQLSDRQETPATKESAPGAPEAKPEQRSGSSEGLRAAVVSRGFLFVAYALFTTMLFREGIFNVVLPVYAKNVLRVSETELGLIIGAIGLGWLVAAYPTGYVVDRWGLKAGFIPGALLATTALLLSAQAGTANVALGLAMGIGTGIITVSAQAYAIDLSPRGARGHFFGLNQISGHIATIIGPLMIGKLTDLLGFGFPFLLLASLFAVMLPVALVVVKDAPKTETPTHVA